MKTNENLEGNKLIAEFMGYEIKGNDFIYPKEMYHLYTPYNIYEFESGNYNFEDDISGMKFHSSWDWLMPVINKCIMVIGIKTIDECSIYEWRLYTAICGMKISTKIAFAFKIVVEFIKWYNLNINNNEK